MVGWDSWHGGGAGPLTSKHLPLPQTADPDRGWQRCGPRGVAVASEPVAATAGASLRGCAGGREVAAVSGALLRRVSPEGPSPHRWFTNSSPPKFEVWRLRPERPFSTPAAPGPSFAQTSPAHPPPQIWPQGLSPASTKCRGGGGGLRPGLWGQ